MSASSNASPNLRVSRYEITAAAMISGVVGLAALCAVVVAIFWVTRQPPPFKVTPVELVEWPGGFEDGSPDETLRVDSPEPERLDASPAEIEAKDIEIVETLETVLQLSEQSAEIVQQQFDTGVESRGKPGSAKGTGRKPLGRGDGKGGMPREQRWFVRFAEKDEPQEYARQLEFFGIELGSLLPDGRLAYLPKPTQPDVRFVNDGSAEGRLYMTWQAGQRRSVDEGLFRSVGVSVNRDLPIFHFYPPETEAQLARLELDYRGLPVRKIRRTYYAIQRKGRGYEFVVTKQIPF